MKKVLGVAVALAAIPVVGLAIDSQFPRVSGKDSLSKTKARVAEHGAIPEQNPDHNHLGYPNSYYRSVVKEPIVWRDSIPANETIQADVCVIGAGLTGITTALSLAEAGKRVIILESKRIAWNASGRNGGFGIAGFGEDPIEMEEHYGAKTTKKYYQMTLDALHLVKERIKQYAIQCDFQDHGFVETSTYRSDPELDIEAINERLGTSYEIWDTDKVRGYYKSASFHWGYYDPNAIIVNPLGLSLGLARAAESKGVTIYEDSPAIGIEYLKNEHEDSGARFIIKSSPKGEGSSFVECRNVVLAGSCHLDPELDWVVSRSVAPLYTYIGVTEPLGSDVMAKLISPDAPFSACDDTTALNYFRPLPDGRLLWGGFAQTFERDRSMLATDITKLILETFPTLKKAPPKIDYVWGGDIACTRNMYPAIGTRRPGLYYATGFGGHGVIPTSMAGTMIADAIVRNDDSEVTAYQKLFPLEFAGWPLDRIVVQAIIYYERANEWVAKNILNE